MPHLLPSHSTSPRFFRIPALGVLLILLMLIPCCVSPRGKVKVSVRHQIQEVVELPMLSKGGIPLVQVHVNDRGPAWFMVDTGCAMDIVSSRLAQELQLRTLGPARFNGTGEGSMHEGMTVKVGSALYQPDHVSSADFSAFEKAINHRVHGILGQFFFRCFVVELDYAKKVLRLHPPQGFNHGGQPVPIRFRGFAPTVEGVIELKSLPPTRGSFLIDTGANAALRLTDRFIHMHRLEKLTAKSAPFGVAMLHGTMKTHSAQGVRLAVGRVSVSSLLVTLGGHSGQESDAWVDGKIGGEFLRHFRVVIDYPHKRLWLAKPSR